MNSYDNVRRLARACLKQIWRPCAPVAVVASSIYSKGIHSNISKSRYLEVVSTGGIRICQVWLSDAQCVCNSYARALQQFQDEQSASHLLDDNCCGKRWCRMNFLAIRRNNEAKRCECCLNLTGRVSQILVWLKMHRIASLPFHWSHQRFLQHGLARVNVRRQCKDKVNMFSWVPTQWALTLALFLSPPARWGSLDFIRVPFSFFLPSFFLLPLSPPAA